MSRFETTFRTAIANAEKDVLVDQIRANPQMSLSELGKLATGELGNLLKQVTVADLVGGGSRGTSAGSSAGSSVGSASGRGGARGGRKPANDEGAERGNARKSGGEDGRKARAEGDDGRKARGDGGGRKPKASQDEVDTRTAEGRGAYDQAVLEALRGASGPQSASNLTSVAGGSPLQIRTALARLIDAGSVHWSGRARGTRYTAA